MNVRGLTTALMSVCLSGCVGGFFCLRDRSEAVSLDRDHAYVIGSGGVMRMLPRRGTTLQSNPATKTPCHLALKTDRLGDRLYIACTNASYWIAIDALPNASASDWHMITEDEEIPSTTSAYGPDHTFALLFETMTRWEVELLTPTGERVRCRGDGRAGWLMDVAVDSSGREFAILTDHKLILVEQRDRRFEARAYFSRSGEPTSYRPRCRRLRPSPPDPT